MKKIGIFGGTFDPFHKQHLKIAIAAYQNLKLDQVWILPTKQNPLKNEISATSKQRIDMINLAISDYDWLKLNDYEINQATISYTIDTICHFIKHYWQHQFFLIIGCDNLYTLEKWKDITTLVTLVQIVVVNRPYYRKSLSLMKKYQCLSLVVSANSINATKIRNGEITNQTAKKVNDYINNHLVYVNQRLKFNLDNTRMQHCLNAGDMAVQLARVHNVDLNKAKIAAIYHDLCKQWPQAKQLKYLEKYNKVILKEPFAVWHGYVAALYLKYHYRYQDDSIMMAVAKHTTGDLNMSALELVVLLADKIAIGREQPYFEKLRELAFKDLKLAFKYYLQVLKAHLLAQNKILNQRFLKIYKAWCK